MKIKYLLLFIIPVFLLATSRSFGGRPPDSACRQMVEGLKGPDKWLALEKLYSETDSAEDFDETPPQVHPSLVKPVPSGLDGYAAKILMIRRAQHSIDIGTYKYARDLVTQSMMEEMKRALDRGVNVRILVDSYTTIRLVYSDLRAFLSYKSSNPEGGKIEVRIFNPVMKFGSLFQRWYANVYNLFASEENRMTPQKNWFNRRMHDKVMIIDADYPDLSIAIFGGRNLYEKPHGVPVPTAKSYNDMEVIVKNIPGTKSPADAHAMSDLTDYFNKIYYHTGNRILNELLFGIYPPDPTKQNGIMKAGNEKMLEAGTLTGNKIKELEDTHYLDVGFDPAETKIVNELKNIVRQNSIFNWIVRDKINTDINGKSIVTNFKQEVMKAKESVVLVVPYIYFTRDEIKWLRNWLDEDPARKLTLVVNSISTVDNVIAQTMTDFLVAPAFLKSPRWKDKNHQVKIYAYGKTDNVSVGGDKFYGLMHGKFGIIDGKISMIGTHNSDPRGRYLNSELGGIFYSPQVAQTLLARVESLKANSYEWGSREWWLLHIKGTNGVKAALEPLIYLFLRSTNLITQI